MNDWQPIETAPQDGTPILVFDRRVLLVQWMDDGDEWAWCVAGSWNDDDGYMVADHPTYWMPLPNPPQEEMP